MDGLLAHAGQGDSQWFLAKNNFGIVGEVDNFTKIKHRGEKKKGKLKFKVQLENYVKYTTSHLNCDACKALLADGARLKDNEAVNVKHTFTKVSTLQTGKVTVTFHYSERMAGKILPFLVPASPILHTCSTSFFFINIIFWL